MHALSPSLPSSLSLSPLGYKLIKAANLSQHRGSRRRRRWRSGAEGTLSADGISGPREPNDLPIGGGGHFDANMREMSTKLQSLLTRRAIYLFSPSLISPNCSRQSMKNKYSK